MTKKMLIDATHAEETRVAVINGNKLEEYDYENITRKQLKGNIYLVKVTRVEPSLQAAFVDFGGNRHGFLPFPEVHPDYYRIPIADREALLAEERAIAAAQAAREEAEDEAALAAGLEESADGTDSDTESQIVEIEEPSDEPVVIETIGGGGDAPEEGQEIDQTSTHNDETPDALPALAESAESMSTDDNAANDEAPETDSDSESSETPRFRSSLKRRYKIQEVIKRNQIMLIQISKEERGNKGAAVTSYISLPGRYCVLMPNSSRGGGVSRKVSNLKDRQRLKKILHELNIPEGMSVILRTAGVARSIEEIRRDLDYLLRLWDQIRELTLKSTAPALIYEEGNLIKRAIRDLYRRDINEVHVAGEEGFKTARDFMNTLMPSHVDKIQFYNDPSIPMFSRYLVERQIDEIHNPTVHLKSGGYIVINPTEALVSIDVNSGRATKGRHIEETALKTNLEAAEEIARQLRLRDQGGLIVIDFIDMEDRKGNRIVERRLRDAMSSDRARIQLGRISPFGLLELSRQRLHPSLVESNFETCSHCLGTGLVRTVETAAVMILRAIEEEAIKSKSDEIKVEVPAEVAIYILNHKRAMIADIERRHSQRVFIHADNDLIKPNFKIETQRSMMLREASRPEQRLAPVQTVDMSDLPALSDAHYADDRTVAEEALDEERDFNQKPDTDGAETDAPHTRGHDRGHHRRGRHQRGGGRGDRSERGGQERGGQDRGRHHHQRHNNHQNHRQNQPGSADQASFGAQPENIPTVDGLEVNTADGQPQHNPQQTRPERDGGRHNQRRRGRRGGRNRGGKGDGRGDDRTPRPQHSQQNNASPVEGFSPSTPAPVAQEFVPQNRPERAEPIQPRVQNVSSQQDTAPVVISQSNDGEGKSRKGWWKRLTE